MCTGDGIHSRFGRTSYENVIAPCRALSCCCPVDRVAERHGSRANRNRPTNQLPGITVVAPKQVARPLARPQRQAPPVANTVAARPTSPAPQTPPTSAQKPASGSVMARIAAIEKTSSNCTDGCQTSFKFGNQPWTDAQVIRGVIGNLQKRGNYKTYQGAGKPECSGLETLGGLVVLRSLRAAASFPARASRSPKSSDQDVASSYRCRYHASKTHIRSPAKSVWGSSRLEMHRG